MANREKMYLNRLKSTMNKIRESLKDYPYFYKEVILNQFSYNIRGNKNVDNQIQITYFDYLGYEHNKYIDFDLDLLTCNLLQLEGM